MSEDKTSPPNSCPPPAVGEGRAGESPHPALRATFSRETGEGSWKNPKFVDKILLNRFFGVPLFLASMYLVFIFTIHVGGIFQDFFDIASRTLFIDAVQQWLTSWQAPPAWIGFAAFGIGQGINTTLTFVPVIASMFLCLSFLEASGFMARIAYVMEKFMQWVGLPGRSFVPMVIGFGCNVPAVLATRSLGNYRERVLTILMTPFMSCGARLAIYALFVSAFFPHNGQNIVFGLYLIGISIALFTGFILRTTLLPGKCSKVRVELPPYQWPNFAVLKRTVFRHVKGFVLKAGALIIPLCVVIGTMGSVQDKTATNTWLGVLGRSLTPVFSPMGITEENWPATVGLLTGVVAKEVVVGTLNALYAKEAGVPIQPTVIAGSAFVRQGLKEALQSIPDNVSKLSETFLHPLSVKVSLQQMQAGALGVMVERFQGTVGAFAYLLFVLLYFPCVSVVAVISRELNKSWALFSVLWTTGVAYAVAVLFYQCATFKENPMSATAWILGIVGIWGAGFLGLRKWVRMKENPDARLQKRFPTQILIH